MNRCGEPEVKIDIAGVGYWWGKLEGRRWAWICQVTILFALEVSRPIGRQFVQAGFHIARL